MHRGIIDLIQENRKRFYAGEIRNRFYEDNEARNHVHMSEIEQQAFDGYSSTSLWKNLKQFGQKFTDDLFYEPL